MDSFSLEDFFLPPDEQASPGSQIYLYRILNLLASEGSASGRPGNTSYQGAKGLAVRLGIDSAEKLASLFRDLGLGEIEMNVDEGMITVSLAHSNTRPSLPLGNVDSCELERGIIDGALEIITGKPVCTSETSCWSRGSERCVFEAFRNAADGQDRYSPRPVSSHPSFSASHSLDAVVVTQVRIKSWYLDLAARELARSRRHGRPLSVVYLDLDDLGQVNDEHGRKAGDQIIGAVSAALSRACRAEDYLWYNGEDEFALVLSETDTRAADVVAKRLSTAVLSAAENIDFAARVSASIGFSTFPADADDINSLLESARSAQYLAKARGKGRIQAAVAVTADETVADQEETEETLQPAVSEETAESADFSPRRSMAATEETEGEAAPEPRENEISFVVAMSGPLLMAGIKQIFSNYENLKILSEVINPQILADAIEDSRPDIVFSDMAMAIAGDFAALRMIAEENLPCKYIIFADVLDQEVIKIASDFDIDGIILQSSSPREMVTAISAAYEGKSAIPEEAQTAIKELENQRQLLSELSEREIEVLKLVAEGKSNSQIAQDLYITVNTVRFHLANIYQKLSVSNRTEAANYFLKQDSDPDSQARLL